MGSNPVCGSESSYNLCMRDYKAMQLLSVASISNKVRNKYAAHPRLCKNCETPIPYEKRHINKFCGHSCSASYTNKQRQLNKRNRCRTCEGKVAKNRYYCDTECKERYIVNQWLQGSISGLTEGGLISQPIRRYVLRKANHCCSVCGWNEFHPVTGKVPVQVDHIDGNYLNCRPENLRVLCPNHHSLTPTFGALNKGRGRSYRNKK